jgi:hypothetical protein
MSINLSYQTVTVPANQTLPVAKTGSVFFCVSASARFSMNFGGGEDIDMASGWKINAPFKRLLFINTTAAPLVISFYTGQGSIDYSLPPLELLNTTVKNASTYAKGGGNRTLQPGEYIDLTGLDGTHARKQVVVTNLSLAGNLTLIASGANMSTVLPVSSWTIETNSALRIANLGAVPVDLVFGEVFYA